MELSIVIPTYNESCKIERDLRAAQEFLQCNRLIGEIVVVDDGSQDGTAELAQGFQLEMPNLRVLTYAQNRGKGYAVRYGMTRAEGEYVMFADAGLCVPFEFAMLGMIMIRGGLCDLAVASRRARGSHVRDQPLYRSLGSKAFYLIVHFLMGIPWSISDTQCGFKIFRRDVARKLFSEAISDGFMLDVDILLRAVRAGYRVLEFPVRWRHDGDTRFHPMTGTWPLLRQLWGIKRQLRAESRR